MNKIDLFWLIKVLKRWPYCKCVCYTENTECILVNTKKVTCKCKRFKCVHKLWTASIYRQTDRLDNYPFLWQIPQSPKRSSGNIQYTSVSCLDLNEQRNYKVDELKNYHLSLPKQCTNEKLVKRKKQWILNAVLWPDRLNWNRVSWGGEGSKLLIIGLKRDRVLICLPAKRRMLNVGVPAVFCSAFSPDATARRNNKGPWARASRRPGWAKAWGLGTEGAALQHKMWKGQIRA